MSIDWTKPLVVAGTDRVATVEQKRGPFGEYAVKADWVNTGNRYTIHFLEHGISRGNSYRVENAVTNAPPTPDVRALVRSCNEALGNVAPPTPQLGPEHIEALAGAIEEAENKAALNVGEMVDSWTVSRVARAEAAAQRAARLAEIRAYLERL